MKRPGNITKRRIVAVEKVSEEDRQTLAETSRYEGSGHHKRSPADYCLPRTNPRPHKSLCDAVKAVPIEQARRLLAQGFKYGMFSDFSYEQFPKFVWSVDEDGDVYEAKTSLTTLGVACTTATPWKRMTLCGKLFKGLGKTDAH